MVDAIFSDWRCFQRLMRFSAVGNIFNCWSIFSGWRVMTQFSAIVVVFSGWYYFQWLMHFWAVDAVFSDWCSFQQLVLLSEDDAFSTIDGLLFNCWYAYQRLVLFSAFWINRWKLRQTMKINQPLKTTSTTENCSNCWKVHEPLKIVPTTENYINL